MALDPARQAALHLNRARALVAGSFDVDTATLDESTIPGAIALRTPAGAGFVVFGPAGGDGESRGRSAHDAMGAALVWAAHADVGSLVLLSERDAGVHARRAGALRSAPVVREVRGAETVPATPSPLPPVVEVDPAAFVARPVLEAAGLEVVIEGGHMTGEVAGLEVARVVVDDGEARVEVGVGRFDRAAASVLHGDAPVAESLARVSEQIARSRRPGAGADAIGRLCRGRWLRSHLVAHPERVGVRDLRPVEPPVVRQGLRHEVASPALGVDPDDSERVLVMATVGFDPGLVPLAADLVLRYDVHRVVVAVPPRDVHALLGAVVADLPGGVVHAVVPPWDPQPAETAVD